MLHSLIKTNHSDNEHNETKNMINNKILVIKLLGIHET